MITALLTLSLVTGISAGLASGYAIFVLLRAVSRRMDDPTGFVFRLPYGILIYGIKTYGREEPAGETSLRVISRRRRYARAPAGLPRAA